MCERERWPYALLVALVFFSAAALAHGQSTNGELSQPSSPRESTGSDTRTPRELASELISLLEQSVIDSDALDAKLRELSSELELSEQAFSELLSSHEELRLFCESLMRMNQKQNGELRVWRGAAIVGWLGFAVLLIFLL